MALSPQCRLPALLACLGLACSAEAPPPEAPPPAAVANAAPLVERLAFEPTSPLPGETLRVRSEVVDPDGDPVAMVYDWSVDGQPVGDGNATLRLPDSRKGQRVAVRVIASDGRLDSKPATLAVEVGDQPAQVEGLEIQPGHAVTAGEWISVHARAVDADGDAPELVYRWSVNGNVVEAAESRFDTSGLQRGDRVEVEARIDDATGNGLISPPIQITNAPPRVVSRPVPPGADGFQYHVEAVDPDGDAPLRFSLENPPRGMTIEALTGEVHWRPTRAQAGTHPIEILVDDGNGGRVSHAFELRVGGSPPASPPEN